jgi:hypothetical protein
MVALNVRDQAGNYTNQSCFTNVRIRDLTAPAVTCPPNTTVNCTATVPNLIPQLVATDNCTGSSGIVKTQNPAEGSALSLPGPVTVTFTARDYSGNIRTCTSIITISDPTSPTFTSCPANITVNNDAGICGRLYTYTAPTATDNCGTPTVTLTNGQVSGSTLPVGATSFTFRATDLAGNTSTCSWIVTVRDVAPPTALCQNITVSLNGSGTASITAAQLNNGSTDNCISQGALTLSASATSFTCSNVGANTVTLTVTDVNSNTSTCTSVVTVQDTTSPVALCRNVTATLDGSGNVTVTAAQMNNGSSDNCGANMIFYPASVAYTCAGVGAHTVSLSVTDASGNSSTCISTVTVQDNTSPSVLCRNVTATLDETGSTTITSTQLNNNSSDNCSGPLTFSPASVEYTCADVGMQTVTLTVTDAYGNTSSCTSTVTVQDVTPPKTICTHPTVFLDNSGTVMVSYTQIDSMSNDNCWGALTFSPQSVSYNCSQVGSNTYTLTVMDASGNTSTCSATVTVQDNILPEIYCKDITVMLDETGTGSITGTQINNNTTDNCSGPLTFSVSNTSFTCSDIGASLVLLSATDVNGNTATCTSIVTVEDTAPPTATCRNITAALDGSGNATVTSSQINNGSTDNCGGILTFLPASVAYTCADVGARTVSLSVTDANGNTSTCTSTITVQDVTPPTAMCAHPTVFLDNSGTVMVSYTQISNMSGDNCGGGLTYSPLSVTYDCTQVGANSYTLTVSDASGNVATCTATVTVKDVTPPVATCRNITANLDGSGNATVTAAQINNGSTDNCGGTLTFLPASVAYTCADVGARTVSLSVTDANGNTSTCTSAITVQDVTPQRLCAPIRRYSWIIVVR